MLLVIVKFRCGVEEVGLDVYLFSFLLRSGCIGCYLFVVRYGFFIGKFVRVVYGLIFLVFCRNDVWSSFGGS